MMEGNRSRVMRLAAIVVGVAVIAVCTWFVVRIGPLLLDEALGGPRCRQGPTSPILIDDAIQALQAEGFSIANPSRAPQCHDETRAQLRDVDGDLVELNCLVFKEPRRANEVVVLPDTSGGAVHVAGANIDCFSYVSADAAEERQRLTAAVSRMLAQ